MRLKFALCLAGVVFLAAGCTGAAAPGRAVTGSPSPSPTGPSAKDLKDQVVAALGRTHAAPFRYAVESNLPESGNVSATGLFDLAGRLFEATTTVTGGTTPGTSRRIVVGTDSYQRQGDEKTWVRLDLSRIKPENTLLHFDMGDPIGLAKFTAAVNLVERKDGHTYTGRFTADAVRPFLPVGAPSVITFGVRNALFTLITDEQDRVVSIHVEVLLSDGPKLVMATTFSEHGKPLPTKAPPKGSVRDAAEFYYN